MNEYYSLTKAVRYVVVFVSSERRDTYVANTKEPEVRRQEILDTAMKLFYEKGYEKTSITDNAREMGVAQGLCYPLLFVERNDF